MAPGQSLAKGLLLAEHKPFESALKAIQEEIDLESNTTSISSYPQRMFVNDTDRGSEIQYRISALQDLVEAYKAGLMKEKS